PALGEFVALGDVHLELVGAPSGIHIEGQPLADRSHLGGAHVVREDAGVDDGVVGTSEVVIRALARVGWLATDDSGRSGVVARWNAGDGAHVTVLTANTPLGGWRIFVFTKRFFQPESIDEVHIVARPAEGRLGELLETNGIGMDGTACLTALG